MLNVLGISITFIPSVLLCGHCQLNYLFKQGLINYKFVPEHFLDNKTIEWADVLVFIRSDSDLEAYVSKIAREKGKRLIYVLDDDLQNVPSYASSYYYYSLSSTKRNMLKVMSNCDVFLTPSPVLLEKYGSGFKYKFLIKEPSLNRIQLKQKNDIVKIGFAGSIDRTKDINDILEETIRRLCDKYKEKISIEFFGAHPDIVDELGLKYYPYQDGYDAYTAYMAKCNWDIGLAPMPESDFHRCKYFNKYVEYASFGIVGVYSNVEPYIYGIRDGENGLLVENTTEAWVKAISRLIDDNDLRNRISHECLKEANGVYDLESQAIDYFDKATFGFGRTEHVDTDIRSFDLIKKTFTVRRLFRKIVEKKLDFPKWLSDKLKERERLRKERTDLINNTRLLLDKVKKQDTVFFISPYVLEDEDNAYVRRVRTVDNIFNGFLKVYVDGEDRALDSVRTKFIDDNMAVISFNSFVREQCEEVISIIECGKACLIHNVERFLPEKLGIDFYSLIEDKEIFKIWDYHYDIPERYHKDMNFHTESLTSLIEKDLWDNCDALVINDTDYKTLLKEKYNGEANFIEDNQLINAVREKV